MIVVERISKEGTIHRVTIRAHELFADMGVEDGGSDAGPNAHDFYDTALGACKALTMLWYAQRKGIDLQDIYVGVERDASEEREGVYRLKTRVAVDGDLSEEQRAKLVEVAGKCPVHKLMTEVRTEIETIAVPPRARA